MSKEIKYWTSVLKKIIYFSMLIFGIFITFKLSIFYIPFLIAFIISLIMEPQIKFLMSKFKFNRKISSIIIFIITFGIILGLLLWGITTLITESTNLLTGLNDYYYKAYDQIQRFIGHFKFDDMKIPSQIVELIKNTSVETLEKISSWLQKFFSNFLSLITMIPSIAIYFGVTIISLYFLCTDRIYMLDELEHHLPKKWMKKISKHVRELIEILGNYLKAQLILIIISFCICLVGLYILHFINWNVKFPLLFAIGIAFVDALPLIGSGTVMIPWAFISGIDGDLKLGIAICIIWIIMSLTRQFIEPKIVSSKIGVHPIFTIIAMYTGFKLIGVLGMFIGPIFLIILKNIFSNLIDEGIFKTIFENN